MDDVLKLSAVVLTENEERNLLRLCKSLSGWVDEIVVVDNHSRDRTLEIAAQHQAKIISSVLTDFSSQRNIGIDAATGDWIFMFDADEEVPDECVPRFLAAIRQAAPAVGGFRVLRKNYVLGHWMRHGQEYGKRVMPWDFSKKRQGFHTGDYIGGAVKLFRKQGSRFQNLVHEEISVPGKIVQLQAWVNHFTGENIEAIFHKVNFYTTLHARSLQEKGYRIGFWAIGTHLFWLPLRTFMYYWLRKQGFRDGFPGLVRSASSAGYEWLKYLKLIQLQRENAPRPKKIGSGT